MSTSSPASSDDEHDKRKQQDTEGTSLNCLSSKQMYGQIQTSGTDSKGNSKDKAAS